jgi:hypothetical protein
LSTGLALTGLGLIFFKILGGKMKKVFLTTLTLLALAGCGRTQQDPGGQFSVKSTGDFQTLENGGPATPILREDENSGPGYKIEGDLGSIEYFDKKLSCGPVAISSRRALKFDSSFSSFKISEAEFHGLNQLPQHAPCTLSVTSTNGGGSTITKKSVVDLHFDSSPSLQLYREEIAQGNILVQQGSLSFSSGIMSELPTVPMDYYEITNLLPYSTAIVYKPTRSIHAWPGFTDGEWGSEVDIYTNEVLFEPADLAKSGSLTEGFKFKIAPGATVKIRAYARLSGAWIQHSSPCVTFSPRLEQLQILYAKEVSESLIQAAGFDFSSEDYAAGRVVNTKKYIGSPFKGMKYNAGKISNPGVGSRCLPPPINPG